MESVFERSRSSSIPRTETALLVWKVSPRIVKRFGGGCLALVVLGNVDSPYLQRADWLQTSWILCWSTSNVGANDQSPVNLTATLSHLRCSPINSFGLNFSHYFSDDVYTEAQDPHSNQQGVLPQTEGIIETLDLCPETGRKARLKH